mgnify:CR=1 FL=1
MSNETLEQDISFLLERQDKAGSFSCGEGRDTGISSNALVKYAYLEYTGISGPDKSKYPSDPPDLAACFRAYMKLPLHRKTVDVAILLAGFADHVGEKYRSEVADMFYENPEWKAVYDVAWKGEQKLRGEQ